MEQDEQEDPALAAKKAALLAFLDAPSSVNGHGDFQEAYLTPSVSEGSGKSETSVQNCTLQSVEQMEQGNGIPSTMHASSPEADCHKNSEFICVDSESPNTASSPEADCNKNSEFTCVDSESPNIQEEIFAPLLALNFEKEFQSSEDNFTKGCKWSPDGSCLLVGSNDKMLRIFNLPSRVACGDIQDESWFFEESSKHINPALTMKEGECIYDYTWYPAMHSSDAQSCCFAVTCRGCPVHLWDAWHGKLICSYLPYDHLDQLVAAYSIAFNLDGSKLFCGFNKAIRIFQVSRPGREFVKIDARDQPGIISCMAFNPVLPSVFVAGSYLGNLGLYSTDRNALFCRIDGCPGGMTQIQFSSDGIKLFSGARMNNKILCWDLRNPGKLLWSFRREVKTNQRISFDLEPHSNNFLVSGTTNGSVLKWSLQDLPFSDGDDPEMIKTSSKFVAHKDCCNGVSLNPHFPVLATSSGQRHFPEPQSFSSSDSCSEDDGPLFLYRKNKYENSVKLWWLG
ncbi:telomerase Cajal body protein 1 [Macrobrachium rosenbergii]|uniref:telomerase Cajal body protein 1 n=1 Tax=Macrobrachium rosenbergii TaxID=79674 RepID=UPI0034D6687B